MIQFRENFIWKAASSVIITICNGTDENILFMGICFFHPKQAKYMQADQMDYFKRLFASDSASHTRGDEEISHNCQSMFCSTNRIQLPAVLAYLEQVNFSKQ